MSKVIEHKMREVARPTKEVLGEHLYHKISLALSQFEFDAELQLEGRLTGMLMELPTSAVTDMLASQGALNLYICQSMDALAQLFPELQRLSMAFKEQAKLSLTQRDIGSLIYTSVAKLEPELASKITGMLLELDSTTLWSLLHQENTSFLAAVGKAKRALIHSSQQNTMNGFTNTALLEDIWSQKAESDGHAGNDEILRTQLGSAIYAEAMSSHPECAANITGMLLELSVSSLTEIVNDKEKLASAIDKSYRAWYTSVS